MKSLSISNNADEGIKVNFGIRQANGNIKRHLVDVIPYEPLFDKEAENKIDKIIDGNNLLLYLKQLLLVEYNMLYHMRKSVHIDRKQTSTNKIRFIENEIKLLEEISIDFDGKSKFVGQNHYTVELPDYGIIGKIKDFENDQKRQFDKSNDYFFKEFIAVAEFGLINKFENAHDLLFICPDKDKHQYTYNCRPETSRFWECFLVIVYNRIKDYLEFDLDKEINNLNTQIKINLIKGFDCKLKNIDEIHTQMTASNFIVSDLEDFKAIFSKEIVKKIKPIIWLIKSEKGKKKGHGNQMALREFLVQMLGKINAEAERKIPIFFEDELKNKMKINKSNKKDNCKIGFDKIIHPNK